MSSPISGDDLDSDYLSAEDCNWESDDPDNISLPKYPTPYGYGYPPGVNGNGGFYGFSVPAPPSPPKNSAWDFLNPFETTSTYEYPPGVNGNGGFFGFPTGPSSSSPPQPPSPPSPTTIFREFFGSPIRIYEVFLSFRGEDTRASFTSHLHTSLLNAGITVFMDDDEIERGDSISASLLRAIDESQISVIVFSRNYADSRWCLQELVKIMECHRTIGQVVLPVFYDVDPSEVRHQTGEFGNAFENLLNRISKKEDELNWRMALREAGGLAGFVVLNSRNESADVKNIVEHVTRSLDREELFVAEHPVGVEYRVQVATKLLNIQESKDVLLLGIWGMGGVGKTTIAKAIYNQIGRNFEGRSFLPNIREVWQNDTNRVSLQQLVLCDIYKMTTLKIHNIESGKNILREKLSQKRVLLVLDDVNELDQLNALCASREWFGPGSRIIITTRDKHLLRFCRVDHVHRIEEMDESESLEHFSWHAFKQASPRKDFATLSKNMIAYSGRLPLALEVLGSYLFDRGITEWQSVLEKLKKIPNDQVHKKLKISFDGLSDDTEKEIFLDIACFCIGMDRNDVIQILNGCGFFAEIGISVLVDRSLVIVDNKNKLRMHDLLRDMGREIIREESPNEPEERSRLWLRREVLDILTNHKGTKAVKGLALELPRENTICLNTKAFKKMNRLRLLQLSGVRLDGDFKYLARDLRLLCWHGFPSTYTPEGFQQGSLVAIDLKYSNLKQIWKKGQMLENLKILNLSHSRDLTETPDFSYLPNLEKLVLEDCPSLSVVSHTIGYLHKLLLINLRDCTGLQNLPRSIYKLKSLETLILSGCSMIDKMEEDIEQMESLTTLIADKTAITEVPFSIIRSKRIGYISLCGFEGFSRDVFPSIILSWMSPTNNVISLVQTSSSVSSLVSLDFPYGSSYILSSIFEDLPKLQSLCVECGSELQLTQDVARILNVLKATNCQKLEASATTSQISDMYASPLVDFCSQVHISGSNNYLKSLFIQMGTKCQVLNIAKASILQTTDGTGDSDLLPYDNNPDWLTFSCKGCSVIFEVPKMKGRNLKRMMLCIIYSSSLDNIVSEGFQNVLIINHTKAIIQAYKRETLTSFEDEEWQSITSNLVPGDKVEVMVVFGEGFIVEKTAVYLLYDEAIDKEMEHCHAVGEGVFVSGDDDKNVSVSGGDDMEADKNFTVSGGDDIDVLADKNVIIFGEDENVSAGKHWHAVNKDYDASGDDDMAANKNYDVSGGGDDMQANKNVIVSGEDENVIENKCRDAIDKDVTVSGDDDMQANNPVSGGDENRLRRLVTLPSLVRAVLISRPFSLSLVSILVWITCHHFKKRRRSWNLVIRYTLRKWLVDCAQKLINYLQEGQ